jgi:hypothetical protein
VSIVIPVLPWSPHPNVTTCGPLISIFGASVSLSGITSGRAAWSADLSGEGAVPGFTISVLRDARFDGGAVTARAFVAIVYNYYLTNVNKPTIATKTDERSLSFFNLFSFMHTNTIYLYIYDFHLLFCSLNCFE